MPLPLDSCTGLPLPWSDEPCAPGDVDVPICYAVPPSTVPIAGVKRITLLADCTASGSVILDLALAPVPGAVEIGCITEGAAEFVLTGPEVCAVLGTYPLQVYVPTDPVVVVGAGGCYLAVPAGAGGFPGFGVPVTATGDTNAAGVSGLAARADHLHRVEVIVQEEGVLAGARPTLNFIGDRVSAVDDAINDRVNITFTDFDGGTITSPILSSAGTCAAPAYSFALEPDSGLLAVPTANVTLGWNSCASFVRVGDVVRIEDVDGDFFELGPNAIDIEGADSLTVPSPITVTAGSGSVGGIDGADINISGGATPDVNGGTVCIIGGANLGAAAAGASICAGGGQTDTTGGDFTIAGGLSATGNGLGFIRGGTITFGTSASGAYVDTFTIGSAGQWLLSGNAGIAGQHVTSAGPGAPPTWDTPGALPILAAPGSCGAPTYSFAASPDSGMFYTGTAVRVSDDNCVDYVEVGASINLVTASGLGPTIQMNSVVSYILIDADQTEIKGRDGSNTTGTSVIIHGADMLAASTAGSVLIAGGFSPTRGGDVNVNGGANTAAAGQAGHAQLAGGTDTAGTGTPGNAIVRGGASVAAAPGGDAFVISGTGTTSIANSGDVVLARGNPTAPPFYIESLRIDGPTGAWLIGGVAGTNGYVLKSQGAGLPPVWDNSSAMITWGAFSIAASADTRVLPVGYDPGTVSTLSPRGHRAPRGGIYRHLFVQHNQALGNGASVAYTLRVNGVNTALTVSLATGAIGSASNLVTDVVVAQGDFIEMIATKAVAIGNGNIEVYVTLGMA